MSNIIIRNIVGTGAFAVPTTDDSMDSLDAAIRSILDGISGFTYLDSKGDTYNLDGEATEVIAIISAFSYGGSICPNTTALRSAIESAFLADANVTSIGDIDIKIIQEGGFYERYPVIERVDDVNGIVHFTDNIPPGAQIEVYKYSPHPTGTHGDPYPSNVGKRYRPDRLLAKGSVQANLSTAFLTKRRAHFRFAFRWPIADNSGGAGVRGPLSDTTISTAVPRERLQGSLLIINPAPSGFGRY
jgi:hypothetical protein